MSSQPPRAHQERIYAGIYAKILFSRSLTFFKPIVPTICSRQSSTRNGPKNWWTLSPLTSLVPSYKYVAFYPMKIPSHTGAKIHILSKNSHIENPNFYKIHLSEISFFTKFTFLKSHFHKIHNSEISIFTKFTFSKPYFSQNSHFLSIKFLGISG